MNSNSCNAGNKGNSAITAETLTKAMAVEWGKFGINSNAICPGYIDTEINHHHWETEGGQKLINMLPRKRVGQPRDLDALLVMLASKESDFINGAVVRWGQRCGVPTPVNQTLVACIKGIERTLA